MGKIQQAESQVQGDPEPGRKLHTFDWNGWTIRIDVDITRRYRFTLNQGNERRFSFTVLSKPGDYDGLKAAFLHIQKFINDGMPLKKLPRNEVLIGHFYGYEE